MDMFFSFVRENAILILTVDLGIPAVYFYGVKGKETDLFGKLLKGCSIVVAVAVLIICFQGYIQDGSNSGETKNPDDTVTMITEAVKNGETTAGIPVKAVLTEKLPKEAYDSVVASSTYTGDTRKHDAVNLIDGHTYTNWSEGVTGNGEGEYVDFVLFEEEPLAGFVIAAGNHSGDTYYANNARPKTITLQFGDGSEHTVKLKDEKKEQRVYFDHVVFTDRVRLTIDTVYPGREWKDTVISEIGFYVQEVEK